MSAFDSDVDSTNENIGLIQEKSIPFDAYVPHKKKAQKNVYQYTFDCLYKVWRCFVLLFSVFIFVVLLGAVFWYYLETNLAPLKDADIPDFAIDTSFLPNDTVRTLLNHEEGNAVTKEEESILKSIFSLFDFDDHDGKWNKKEFEKFIDTAIEPEKRFDDIDFDGNGRVTFAELTLFLESYSAIDMYKCDRTSAIIRKIFGYKYRGFKTDRLYFEYMSHLWFKQLAPNNMKYITKDNYVNYIDDEEWEYHNKNDNYFVEFNEFKESFFDSIYYTSYKKYTNIEKNNKKLINNIALHLESIDIKTIVSFRARYPVHTFDEKISKYIDIRPSESILYQLPHIYTAHMFRRRLAGYRCSYQDDDCFCNTNVPLVRYGEGCMAHDNGKNAVWMGECREGRNYGCFAHRLCVYPEDSDFTCVSSGYECLIFEPNGLIEYGCVGSYIVNGKIKTCFAENGMVTALSIDSSIIIKKRLKDVYAGDYVFDGNIYTKVIFVKKSMDKANMVELQLISDINGDKTSITLTGDHLLYDIDMNLVCAFDIKIGDRLVNDYVVYDINYDKYEAHSTPVTMSGKIQVDNITASCYIGNTRYAQRSHDMMAPMRFISRYISDSLAEKIWLFVVDDAVYILAHYDFTNVWDLHWMMDYIFSVYAISVLALKIFIQSIF